MTLKNLFICFFLLFTCIGQSVAGNPGKFALSEKSSYVFRYDPSEENSLNNFFIEEIARYNFLNLYRTEYSIKYDLAVDIKLLPGNKIEVHSKLLNIKPVGDIYYKDFDLSEVLIPPIYSFGLHVVSGGELVENILVNEITMSVSHDQTIQLASAYPTGKLNFEVSDFEFKYLEKNRRAFEERISEINDYLALGQVSVFQLDKAEKIDPENAGALLPNYFKIYDLERYLAMVENNLENIPFEVPAEHVEFLGDNLKKLDSHRRRLNTLFIQTLNASVVVFDNMMLERAAEVLIGMQLDYLEELKNQSFFYEPMYQTLAGFFVTDSSVKILSEKLNWHFNFSNPIANSSRSLDESFKNILLETYISIADSLILQEKFHEVVVLLESAQTICNSIQSIDCELLIFNKLSISKWGIYDAYIRVAQSAIETDNLDMGRNYLKMASGFQSSNKSFIATNGFTLVEFEKLAWEYFQQGNTKFKSGQFQQALSGYTNAQQIYRALNISIYDEIIERKIDKTILENK